MIVMLNQHAASAAIKVGLKSCGPIGPKKATGRIYFGRPRPRVENQVGRVGSSDELRSGATYNGPGPTQDRPMPTLRHGGNQIERSP
jgi:hypothetical protein